MSTTSNLSLELPAHRRDETALVVADSMLGRWGVSIVRRQPCAQCHSALRLLHQGSRRRSATKIKTATSFSASESGQKAEPRPAAESAAEPAIESVAESAADSAADSAVESAEPKTAADLKRSLARKAAAARLVDSRVRRYKPFTPGLRHLRRPINDHLWKKGPYKPLTLPKKGISRAGRNNTGRITVRHRGGGHKRRIRTVDFTRRTGGAQTVTRVEYDPGRSAHIALLEHNQSKTMSYIVAAEGMRAGDTVESYVAGIPAKMIAEMGGSIDLGVLAARTALRGNCLPVHLIPPGLQIYAVGIFPHQRAVFCRSAGSFATIVGRDASMANDKHVVVKLQSGEVRKIHRDACATIGRASNQHWHLRQLGKAGRSRWLGIRPTVRGVAMNAVDHPHGGGRGKSKGNRHPVSPWGTPAKSGFRTRKKRNKHTMLVHDRPRNQGKRRTNR